MGEDVINSDPFGAVFGACKNDGSGLERLPHIAAFAVKQGFAVLPVLGGGEPVCTLPGKPKAHDCGLAHAIAGVDSGPAAMSVFRRMARIHGDINLAVVPHLSGMLHIEVRGAGRAAWLAARWNGSPTVVHGQVCHYWFRLPEGAVTRSQGQVPVPPSVIGGEPFRMVSPPREAPGWMLEAAGVRVPEPGATARPSVGGVPADIMLRALWDTFGTRPFTIDSGTQVVADRMGGDAAILAWSRLTATGRILPFTEPSIDVVTGAVVAAPSGHWRVITS